ncbi:MauE/DoxX family redox-associated membrane protein [Mariniflexile jejuense]|uniref:MauE/DoxX family redox-associated membrane protein n=1 Tax=Mariniflexile jejuense TaxID=1173582 RepID=A0ABW3JP54_9FLAO
MNYPWHLYAMALLYVVAGFMHFIKPKMYLRIMPKYLPNHKFLVLLSGISEIILGLGICLPLTKKPTIYLIIAMLLVFLTVHIYMLTNKKASAGLPKWLLVLRIPMQFALMYWAYSYLNL